MGQDVTSGEIEAGVERSDRRLVGVQSHTEVGDGVVEAVQRFGEP